MTWVPRSSKRSFGSDSRCGGARLFQAEMAREFNCAMSGFLHRVTVPAATDALHPAASSRRGNVTSALATHAGRAGSSIPCACWAR